ncbi:hypothetical protein BDM02DRAFT_3119935 [Thelephora ganbajun]|uniref:Uncharacterized protein n=1 Tax=Thelephora ganbajun TaxID=370292 RepID=A0ACB6Z8E8_THEGA|nr:hypothetical protein BDM02DRAFT_3119935 [Thelephora ganbajun]
MSGSSRDPLFPVTSIGRSHGQPIQRSASPSPSLREPLATHPLLSPSPSNPSPTTTSPLEPTNSQYPTTTRYVPYISKHRVSGVATTGTTNHSPLSVSTQQPHHGDATSKLQVMNLKAAAQNTGLDTSSVGWAILEKLIHENDHSPEWNEIWHALSIDKATLLLPLEPNTEVITAEFIRSHIVFCDNLQPAGSISPFVTLSGLRATLYGDQLVFRSSIHSSSKLHEKILIPATRSTGLASLPPLPATNRAYPTFSLTHTNSGVSHLLLPPRPPQIHKPPLPPRPATVTKPPGQPSTPIQSRLGNPFASLFGTKSTTSTSASNSTAPTDSPATSISTLPDEVSDHPIEIPAYTIDKRIQFPVVAKAVCKELREEVKNSLSDNKNSGLSNWLVNMVVDWLEKSFFPFIKTKASRTSGEVYIVNEFVFEAEEISRTVQCFYGEITDAVVKRFQRTSKLKRQLSPQAPGIGNDRASLSVTEEEVSESEKERVRVSPMIIERVEEEKVRQVMESVEGTICDLFYDRLFIPSNSDDLSHDDALSSRIAALNLLDLSLENLGVEIDPSAAHDMRHVIKACGDILTQLDSPTSRRPAEKSALLVKAHKVIVEELSKLPPVKLRAEAEESGPSVGPKSPAPSPLTLQIKELDPFPQPPVVPKTPTMNGGDDAHLTPAYLTPDPERPQPSPLNGLHHLEEPKPFEPTPVSGDVILPLIIYSVVKSNPPHLLSHLLYIQRFRNESFGGEESYCLINLLAVAEFLENVDLAALGLQAEGVDTSDLTPLPVARSRSASVGSVDGLSQTPTTTDLKLGAATRLRGRVEQQVDAIAGSANKVLSGVVDSSFGVLRALLPGGQHDQNASQSPEVIAQESKPGFGLLKRETGFSIATLAASLPIARQRSNQSNTTADESGQQMMDVSRPDSRVSKHSRVGGAGEEVHESSEESEADSEEEEEEEEEDEEHDTRSIKSFESMMSQRKRRRRKAAIGRKSIADRLANVPGLHKLSHTLDPKSGSDTKVSVTFSTNPSL